MFEGLQTSKNNEVLPFLIYPFTVQSMLFHAIEPIHWPYRTIITISWTYSKRNINLQKGVF